MDKSVEPLRDTIGATKKFGRPTRSGGNYSRRKRHFSLAHSLRNGDKNIFQARDRLLLSEAVTERERMPIVRRVCARVSVARSIIYHRHTYARTRDIITFDPSARYKLLRISMYKARNA